MPAGPDERLRALEDAGAIRELIARYGPLADAGDSVGVAALWTRDGEYDVGGFHVARGRAEIAALIEGEVHRSLMAQGCAHVLSAPAITLAGDAAVAVNHSVLLRKVDDGFEAWRVSANRWELARTSEGWRVAKRLNRPLDGGPEARALFKS
ncbi:MAG: nuclear transport factor 2 family protein [Novosphingobium sp.]|nr:nuclear transport factor 2 family protein [Novosphingobium sp.]